MSKRAGWAGVLARAARIGAMMWSARGELSPTMRGVMTAAAKTPTTARATMTTSLVKTRKTVVAWTGRARQDWLVVTVDRRELVFGD